MLLTNDQKTEILAGLLAGVNFARLIKLYAVLNGRYGVERQGRLYDSERYPDGVPTPNLIVAEATVGGVAVTTAESGGGVPNQSELTQIITDGVNRLTEVEPNGTKYAVGPGLWLRFYLPSGGPLTAEINFVPEQASASIAIE